MTSSVLIAGLGNIFFGDDAFGVEVAQALLRGPRRDGISVRDIGIRSVDLAFALDQPWDLVLLVDTTSRGEAPGTLYVLSLEEALAHLSRGLLDGHAQSPVEAMRAAVGSKAGPRTVLLLGCEPERFTLPEDEPVMGLSEVVKGAIPRALALIDELIAPYRSPVHA